MSQKVCVAEGNVCAADSTSKVDAQRGNVVLRCHS